MGQCGRAGSWVSRQAHWAALDVLRFCSAGRLCSAEGFRGGKFILDVQPAPLSREESDTEGTAWWVAQWNAIASLWRHSKSDGLFKKLKNYQHLWNWGIIGLTQWCMICEADLLFGVQVLFAFIFWQTLYIAMDNSSIWVFQVCLPLLFVPRNP